MADERCAWAPNHSGYGHQGAAPDCVSQLHLIPLGSAGVRSPHSGQGPRQQGRPCYPSFKGVPHPVLGLRTPVPRCFLQDRLEGMWSQERA